MLDRLLKRDTSPAEMPAGTPKILLIDDDEDELTLVRESLSRAGVTYQIDWAPSFEEGLFRLDNGGYQVALVDFRLGEWSGLDILREARLRGSRVPLIMLTGERDASVDHAATALGAVDFLQKGKSSPQEFERAVRFAAANGRALEAARQAEMRVAALEEIGRVLGSGGASVESLNSVVGLVSDRLERPYISLYLAEGAHFRLGAQRGHLGAISILEPGGQLANALRMGKPRFVPNQSAEPDTRTSKDPSMELCIPLLEESKTLGLLFVGYGDDTPIGEAEHAALVSVAGRIADALGLAHDRLDVSSRSVRMRRLGSFMAGLSATKTRVDLEAAIASEAARVVDADAVLVGVTIERSHLKVISSYGPDAAAIGSIVASDPIVLRAMEDGRPASETTPAAAVTAGSGGQSGLSGQSGSLERWTAALPLIRAGRAFGIVQFTRAARPFDVFEREAATLLTAQVALLLSQVA